MIFIVFGVLVRWACAQPPTPTPYSSSRYLDPVSGITPDEAVALALEYNGDLIALRKEVDTAKSLVIRMCNQLVNEFMVNSNKAMNWVVDNFSQDNFFTAKILINMRFFASNQGVIAL